jgi:DnaK suppressor protein
MLGGKHAKPFAATENHEVTLMPKRATPTLQRSDPHTRLEASLEQLREQHAQAIAELRVYSGEDALDRAGDDAADAGTRTMERDRQLTLVETLAERIVQVCTALEQLDSGAYGVCESCAKPIPSERLAVFPSATHCMPCKERAERRR